MKKRNKLLILFISLLLVFIAGWLIHYQVNVFRIKNDIKNAAVDTEVYRPYLLGTRISFANGGNSADYIKMEDGWGGQEPEHRCAVGKRSVVRLYIPDSVGENLRLTIDGFGVFSFKTATYQEVKVYGNDVLMTTWQAGYDGPFTVDIPNNIITDNSLTLRFEFAKPHSPAGDKRKIGMAVRSMEIDRIVGSQTKRKIGKWVKYNLMGGGVKQEYDTAVSKDENWL